MKHLDTLWIIVFLTAPIHGLRHSVQQRDVATTTVTVTVTTTLELIIPTTITASTVQSGLTISITNLYPAASELAVVLAGSPPAQGPVSTDLAQGTGGSWVFEPSDGSWSGNIAVGIPGVQYPTAENSLIEASIDLSTTPSYWFDVSFVNGFSVPITCSSGGATLGCLDPSNWLQSCPNDQRVYVGTTLASCLNPNGPVSGPSPPFNDGSCYATAFTWTLDNQAATGTFDSVINCCVGQSCPTPNINGGENGPSK
jgi:hypothetical protein